MPLTLPLGSLRLLLRFSFVLGGLQLNEFVGRQLGYPIEIDGAGNPLLLVSSLDSLFGRLGQVT